jgi:hypothetical protein
VLAAAVAAHLRTLLLRIEAWRTVLRAAHGERLDPLAVQAAKTPVQNEPVGLCYVLDISLGRP